MRSKIWLLGLICICFTQTMLSQIKYQIFDLEIPGNSYSSACRINNHGQVCGVYSDSNGSKVFFWDPLFGCLPLDVSCIGNLFINDKGTIIGEYEIQNENYRNSVFIWRDKNGLSDYGFLSGKCTQIRGLNNQDEILLHSQNEKDEKAIHKNDYVLDYFNDALFNDHGDIFGYEDKKYGNTIKLFNSKNNRYEEIFFFKGDCELKGFNNNCVAIGQIHSSYGNIYGFIWSKEKGFKILNSFFPIAINDMGQIIGSLRFTNSNQITQLAILDNEEFTIINQSLDLEFDSNTPWSRISYISDINNSGVISATACKNNKEHAVILVPIKE